MSAAHTSEEVSLAQVLAEGGNPLAQLERARLLLITCGGLGAVLTASPEHLAALGLLKQQEVSLLAAVQRIVRLQSLTGRPVIGAFEALETYLNAEAERAGQAETRALLLDHRNRLQADVTLARGQVPLTLDQRRRLVRSCIEHQASGAILVRSLDCPALSGVHPGREASEVAHALEVLEMRLLDYVLFNFPEIQHVHPDRRMC